MHNLQILLEEIPIFPLHVGTPIGSSARIYSETILRIVLPPTPPVPLDICIYPGDLLIMPHLPGSPSAFTSERRGRVGNPKYRHAIYKLSDAGWGCGRHLKLRLSGRVLASTYLDIDGSTLSFSLSVAVYREFGFFFTSSSFLPPLPKKQNYNNSLTLFAAAKQTPSSNAATLEAKKALRSAAANPV